VSFKAEIMHFFGEIEAVFGIWVVPLLAAITISKGWSAAEGYISRGVVFTEPMFVVVVMCIASTRPVLRFAEQGLRLLSNLGGARPGAWWLSILTVGPLLGSLITEPAAMTICALLLARQFYDLKPSMRFCYATLGLLFVNVSVGGTLTHFAAPPVLIVATKWHWDTTFMLTHFGWKAMIGIVVSNLIYFAAFRREFVSLQRVAERAAEPGKAGTVAHRIPAWVTGAHLGFSGVDSIYGPLSGALCRRISLLPRLHHGHRAPPESPQPKTGAARWLLPCRIGNPRRIASLVDWPGPRGACRTSFAAGRCWPDCV
jgi:hypothetical protein